MGLQKNENDLQLKIDPTEAMGLKENPTKLTGLKTYEGHKVHPGIWQGEL